MANNNWLIALFDKLYDTASIIVKSEFVNEIHYKYFQGIDRHLLIPSFCKIKYDTNSIFANFFMHMKCEIGMWAVYYV